MRDLATYYSPIGKLHIELQSGALIGVWLEGQHNFIKSTAHQEMQPATRQIAAWLDDYFSGKKPNHKKLQLAPQGTAFQLAVWDLLCKIPYGEIVTYGEIASKMASIMKRPTMSSQAIGGAVSRNPISIIIPCHRVIGANGNLTGYAGGIDNKIKLLQLEGIDTAKLHMPRHKKP